MPRMNWGRESFPCSPFREALVEADCALLDPLKHVREWKRLCETAGVAIFESTPLVRLERLRVELHTRLIGLDALQILPQRLQIRLAHATEFFL